MDTILSSMLAKAFIISISDEEIEELKQVVDSFLENISIDKLRLSGAVYFERIRLEEFRKELDEHAKALELDYLPCLSNLAYIALAEYILCQMACASSISEEFRFLTSMYIRNFLVLQKTGRELFYPECLRLPLKYADLYMSSKGTISNVKDSLKPKIFWGESWKDILGEDDFVTNSYFEEIKAYAMKAERLDFLQNIDSLKSSHYEDEFQKAFEVAYKLSHDSPWLLVDITPKITMQNTMSKSDERKKLQNLSFDLETYPCDNIEGNSSLLLDYIYNSENRNEDIGQIEFAPQELAIYLYYEFLLEKLLNKYGK